MTDCHHSYGKAFPLTEVLPALLPRLAPSVGALSRLVGQRPALGDCPPPVPLGLYVLERGFQVGHLLFGPCCPQVQFRIWGWSHWSVRL